MLLHRPKLTINGKIENLVYWENIFDCSFLFTGISCGWFAIGFMRRRDKDGAK